MSRAVGIWLGALILLIVTGSPLWGQIRLFDGEPSLSVTYRSAYDSNILRYSSQDRERFENRTELYPSPLTTLDDVKHEFKLSAGYSVNLRKYLETRVAVSGDISAYSRNGIKNMGWLSVTLYQDLSRSLRIGGNYFYEPRFFIRDYKDINTNEYHPCDYATSQGKGELRYRYRFSKRGDWLDVTGGAKFKRYAYNGYFTEYDSDQWEYIGEAAFRTSDWRITAGYSFTVNDNVGFRSTDVARGNLTLTDSELGESDYQEDTYTASIRYSTAVSSHDCYIQIGTEIADRYYTTNRDAVSDPFHSRRHDLNNSITLDFDVTLTDRLDIGAGLEYVTRKSTATAPVVARVKDNDHWAGGIEVNYQIW